MTLLTMSSKNEKRKLNPNVRVRSFYDKKHKPNNFDILFPIYVYPGVLKTYNSWKFKKLIKRYKENYTISRRTGLCISIGTINTMKFYKYYRNILHKSIINRCNKSQSLCSICMKRETNK